MGWNPLKEINSALGDPLGFDAQASAAKANKANLAKIGTLYSAGMGNLSSGYGRALGAQKRATGFLQQNYKSGLRNILNQGDAARQSAIENQKRAFAGIDTSGMGDMSDALRASSRRAVAYDTSHQLAGIDEAISNLASQFQLQGGGQVAGSIGQEGNLYQALAGQQAGLTGNYMGVLGGVQHTAGPGWGVQLAGPLAYALCDLRTKKDAVRVGEVEGVPIYEFEYKGPYSRMLPGRWRGAMAQDLGRFPGAVRAVRGVLFVDNNKIPAGLRVQKVA